MKSRKTQCRRMAAPDRWRRALPLLIMAGIGQAFGQNTTSQEAADAVATSPALPAADAVPVEQQPADNSVSADVQVSPQGRVEMHVRQLELGSVLQMLSLQSKRNIVASTAVTGTVTANLYGVTFEEALTAILDSNNCGWRERGNFIYVYTNDELKAMESSGQNLVTRIFRLYYTTAADIEVLIKNALSEKGKVAVTPKSEVGIASNSEQAGGNALATEDCVVVTDYAEHVEQVARLIAEIDVRPQQVLIEATLLRAGLNEDNALGIDFNLVGGVDFQNLTSVSPAITSLDVGDLEGPLLQRTSFTTRTDFNAGIEPGGITFGLVKDSVAVFVRALEKVTDVSVLSNPKILTLNKQKGEVIVGRRDGYLTTTVTETAAVQNVEFLETGTQLIFRPFVGDDGYIRMEVRPKDSTGGITAANLPFEQTTEVTTNVMVRDGNTILIGGLFREVTNSSRSQVPYLGNIPVAGALVRNSKDTTQREEVIILLTVRLVKSDDGMAKAGAELKEDIERYRVGMRQGVQWFGRERLSQAHYQWALEHLAKGRISRALWDLDLSINNNPKMLAAIRLKEKLQDKRQWDDDGSSVRTFLSELMMRDSGLITPLLGRPGPPFDYPAIEGPNGFDDGPQSRHFEDQRVPAQHETGHGKGES